MRSWLISAALILLAFLASETTVQALYQISSGTIQEPPKVGQWIKIKSDSDFNPIERYGHTAVIYEPATNATLQNLQNNLFKADISKRMQSQDEEMN